MPAHLPRCEIPALRHHILRPHLEALILIFPNQGWVKLQQLGRKVPASLRQQAFGLFGGVFEGVVVIPGLLALVVVPMGNGMDRAVFLRPGFQLALEGGRYFFKRHQRLAAMLADQADLAHVAAEQRQHRRAAARGFRVGGRRGYQPLQPDLPVVGQLRGQPIGAEQRVREAPGLAVKLAQGLRLPARQGQIIKVAECQAVLLPEQVEGRIGVGSHRPEHVAADTDCPERIPARRIDVALAHRAGVSYAGRER